MAEEQSVRETLGKNIAEIRADRGMKGKDLSAKLAEIGVTLSVSGISEVEAAGRADRRSASRKVSAEDLLAFSIALNVSVIDLLMPAPGALLRVADNVEPLAPEWIEAWIRGETPWPPTADHDEFFRAASASRQSTNQLGLRPEMLAIAELKSAVRGAIEGPSEINQIDDPKVMAEYLRDTADRVHTYVTLLADQLERSGYGR